MKKFFLPIIYFLLLASCSEGRVSAAFSSNSPLACTALEIKPFGASNRRIEFFLRKKLLHYTKCPTVVVNKKLELTYQIYEEDFVIQANSIATRKKMGIILHYRLIDLTPDLTTKDSSLLSNGKVHRSGSFYVEDSTYSSLVAQEQELENLLEPIINELLLKIELLP